MNTPLRFNETPYRSGVLSNMLLQFRARGWVTLPDVFDHESVDAFREEVESRLEPESRPFRDWKLPPESPHLVHPIMAPRIRQVLPRALSHDIDPPRVAVFETTYLIAEGNQPEKPVLGWHKDRSREGMPRGGYQYPKDVHLSIYFCDMDEQSGPTQLIEGSHIDPNLSPYDGSAQPVSFLPRKQDVILWDQRCWHQATARTKAGKRINAIYGFYSIPAYADRPREMAPALYQAWKEAENPADEIYLGGIWGRKNLLRD